MPCPASGATCSPISSRCAGGPTPATDVEVDGIAELWFDDADALARGFASAEGKALHADGALFIGRIKSYTTEERVIIGSPLGAPRTS